MIPYEFGYLISKQIISQMTLFCNQIDIKILSDLSFPGQLLVSSEVRFMFWCIERPRCIDIKITPKKHAYIFIMFVVVWSAAACFSQIIKVTTSSDMIIFYIPYVPAHKITCIMSFSCWYEHSLQPITVLWKSQFYQYLFQNIQQS